MRTLRNWLIIAWSVLIVVAATVFSVVLGNESVVMMPPPILFVAVGALIIIKVPGNRIGELLLAGGSAWLVYLLVGEYARMSLENGGTWPGVYLASWLGTWLGALLPVSLAALVTLFPNGVVTGWPRFILFALGALVLSTLIGAWQLWGLPLQTLADWDRLDTEPVYIWIDLAFVAGFLAVVPAVLALLQRFRKAQLIERQQIKWVLTVVGVFAVVMVAAMATEFGYLWEWVVWGTVLSLFPLSIALAVLRYRLYDIDRIVSRTFSYTLVVGLLALVVAGAAALTGSQFETPWVVALTTLSAAALFNPIRLRVQRVVDRRFNRSHYDAGRVMDEFADSLRDEVDPESVVAGWVNVVSMTMQPAAVGVWVRNGSGTVKA